MLAQLARFAVAAPRRVIAGAVLVMIAHGFLAALTFGLNGYIYQQTGTLEVTAPAGRYQRTSNLDASYLTTLSDDAIPYVAPLLDTASEQEREVIGRGLPIRLNQLNRWQAQAGWQGWNWAHWRAYQLLDARRSEIETFPLPTEPVRD